MPYLSADDQRERQQHLEELLILRAAPLIGKVLRRRFGFYANAQGVNESNQDAEDLYQEAMTRVVQVLNQLEGSSTTDIENFEGYVSRIASNICIDFLRDKTPARSRLNASVRDILRRHEDFASWEYSDEILCGLKPGRGDVISPRLIVHRTRPLVGDCFCGEAPVVSEEEVGGTSRRVTCPSSSSTSPCFNFCLVSIA